MCIRWIVLEVIVIHFVETCEQFYGQRVSHTIPHSERDNPLLIFAYILLLYTQPCTMHILYCISVYAYMCVNFYCNPNQKKTASSKNIIYRPKT